MEGGLLDRETRLLQAGYKVYDTCYESYDNIVSKAKKEGYKDIKCQRARTDTKGLKAYVIWVK